MYYLVSFADSLMFRSLKRIKDQANSIDIFKKVYAFDENDLSDKFKKKFKNNLINKSKGYGYCCWKPEIILKVLNEINEGDSLLYVDAGCHLNHEGKKRLVEYFNILDAENKGIVAFQAIEPNQKNSTLRYDGRKLPSQKVYEWTKGDLIDYFGFRANDKIINSDIIGAGVILIKKSKISLIIIKEWEKIIWERFDLLDDTRSIASNFKGYIEHRHDQSIWTLICLKYKVSVLSAYEYWYPKKNINFFLPDWKALKKFPIHAKRDKDLGLFKNIIPKLKMQILKVKILLLR